MRQAWQIGSLLGLLAVALGAFGAHALKGVLTAAELQTWELAVRYQMYHALALLAAGVLGQRLAARPLRLGVWCWVAGTLLFSGSLYVYCLTGIKLLAAITPVGGVTLMVGWGLALWAGRKL
jgi:uncharacterized membrane protein YgdD (TMEM256/DUF423 family)